jgi:hypothetical protein
LAEPEREPYDGDAHRGKIAPLGCQPAAQQGTQYASEGGHGIAQAQSFSLMVDRDMGHKRCNMHTYGCGRYTTLLTVHRMLSYRDSDPVHSWASEVRTVVGV